MNTRIRELAKQADMTRILDEHAHEYGNGLFENTKYPELEKFAELIVRECASLAYDGPRGILEHFGIQHEENT